MTVIRHHRRWLTRLYKVIALMTALVWATDPSSRGFVAGLACVLLVAFAMPTRTRNLRRSEHPPALGALAVTLVVAMLLNRAWVFSPLMLAIWAALAVMGAAAWVLRPASPPAGQEREVIVMGADR